MELVFDVVSAPQQMPGLVTSKSFKQAGGIIGRADSCDWVIPDTRRVISGQHARISHRDGHFFLTDTSSNGIQLKNSGARLSKGEPQRIEHGDVYCLGEVEIQARLIQDPSVFLDHASPHAGGANIIPDDAFLDLDPLNALDQQERLYNETDELAMPGLASTRQAQQDYARIDMESLAVPELVTPPETPAPAPAPEPQRLPPRFWDQFASELGVDLAQLDEQERQALALRVARLLKISVGNLQQSLRTRSELKSEMRLAQTTVQTAGNNPLKHSSDAAAALTILLRDSEPGQLPAEQAVSRAFRDLQAHQVALIAASRAAVKGMLEHLSPEQLTLRFERENKSLISTSGGRWRAYMKLYSALEGNNEWSERLFARDFATAYEEQIRLIATLNTDYQG